MQNTCPYCGDADISPYGAKNSKGSQLYSCSHCNMCFFDCQIPGSADEQAGTETEKNTANETETQELAISLLQKQSFDEACQALDKCPYPWQNTLSLSFLRLIGELGKAGILSETNLALIYKKHGEYTLDDSLDLINDNLSRIDALLPKNEPQQLYTAYCGLYAAFSALADIPIEYYAISKERIFGQRIHTNEYERRYHRTDIWIKRVIAVGTLAQRLEELSADSAYGSKYREMAASLWAKCAEYKRKAPPVSLLAGITLIENLADRVTDYFAMNRQEKELLRQIKAKIQDEKAPVELIYTPKNRSDISFMVHAIPITILVLLAVTGLALALV